MPFKWNTNLVDVTCPHCGNRDQIDVNDFDPNTYIEEEESDNKMGSTIRHQVHFEYYCPSCEEYADTDIEFIEYPEGQCECVNVEGELFKDYDDEDIMLWVDFTINESDDEN